MAKRKVYKKYRTGTKNGGQRYYVKGKPGRLKKIPVFGTSFIQDAKTGLLKGRKSVKNGSEKVGILTDPASGRIFGRYSTKRLKK